MNDYDRVAAAYEAARTDFRERRFVDALVAPLGPGLEILDLGCGTGVPIARHLLDAGHRVTGVDSSGEMVRRAGERVPDARLVLADIRRVQFEARSFDAIVAWDSIFHVPRAEQGGIYERCFEWLVPGGRLLLSCGGSEWEGTATMFGEEFFYSGHEPGETRGILERIGFRIDRWEVDDPSSRGHIAAILTRPGPRPSREAVTDDEEEGMGDTVRDELEDLVEHLERYRAITLQVLDLIGEDDLEWRPGPSQYSLGQQLLHIAQAEDRLVHGVFDGDWSFERVRFPAELPDTAAMRTFFRRVRSYTVRKLEAVDPGDLGKLVDVPDAPGEHSLRSWLWSLLEHELHHRGQVWAYLRAMGYTPPFYARPLPLGERPDLKAREELGGF